MLSLQSKRLEPNQNLPTGKVSIYFWAGLLTIGITVLTILNNRDSTESISDEKKLQVLDAKYRDGQSLSEKEFKAYCDLLERIWKKHLPACYCKDGIENATPGIDWTNAPKSPEDLGSGWVDVTDPRMREGSDRLLLKNKDTGQEVAFEISSKKKKRELKQSHWHRFNPKSLGEKDLYLDECGKPTGKGSNRSHIWIKELEPYGR